MALFEHDIEFGKISKRQGRRMNAADKFSGNLLQQFSKGQIGGSEEMGSMGKFMKNDLRVQASTNQFTQKGFSINKKAITMAEKYYALDKKVRKEERRYYKDTKDVRKEARKKEKLEDIWKKDLLRAFRRAVV